MKKDDSMEVYKVSFFQRIKNKFKKIFSRKKEQNNKIEKTLEENEKLKQTAEIQDTSKIENKREFMKVYYDVKRGNVDLHSLDKDTLYKIMIIINEEIEITNRKSKEKLEEMKSQLENLKIYSKEIEIANKNA